MKNIIRTLVAVTILLPQLVQARGITKVNTFTSTEVQSVSAGQPIEITWEDWPCVGTDCSVDIPNPAAAGHSATLHWGIIDQNGNWTNVQDTPMVGTTESNFTCGSVRSVWRVFLPAQTGKETIKFVYKANGFNGEKWFKDAGKTHNGSGPGLCGGNLSQAGWPRATVENGSDFTFNVVETPYVTLDYPQENEIIRSANYTIRIGANASTNNVRVKIDTGDWSQARFASGYWWFDWANYPVGSHQIIAEGWNELGQRTETSVRNCVYQP